jgi:hypothetical protein
MTPPHFSAAVYTDRCKLRLPTFSTFSGSKPALQRVPDFALILMYWQKTHMNEML